MKNLWNDTEAAACSDELALRVYTSRLLGREHSLVLHGGGNTSVKIREKNAVGEEEDILYVKGSGWDLETIEAQGYTPVRMAHVLKLARLPALSDPDMMNELGTQSKRAGAPAPSVETILHATLPYKYVDHTHADAVLAITNTADGERRIRDVYGRDVVVIPYVMPGFDLARLCAEQFPRQAHAGTIGMVLMNHGIFSFGATARESYERMIALITRAEDYLQAHGAWQVRHSEERPSEGKLREEIAELRRELSETASAPMVLATFDAAKYLSFARRSDVASVAARGPATPDHSIRTKRIPMVGRDVKRYAEEYQRYFERNAAKAKAPKTMLDPAPRVVLDRDFGLGCAARSVKEARISHDIYAHTIDIILRAEALGGWRALPEQDIFDVEYWDLEQAKLRKAAAAPAFAGEIALVTGAASGIGKACVQSLLARGAAVIALDVRDAVTSAFGKRSDVLALQCDVTSAGEVDAALERGVRAFGGLDMLVLNAGIFPGGNRIAQLATEEWQRVNRINLDANLALMRECHPLLRRAPKGGRVVVVGSKNVPAPGPGAAAYSASKAALTQLARVAALEWGADRIRINTVHPNAVFDTGIWTEEVLAERARHYGMSVQEYKTNNVLRTEVTSSDVAELIAEMCGPLFAKTTGAQVPVDGGNDRVI